MTDWLDMEELDAPEMTIPRVLNGPDMLKRLGFGHYRSRRWNLFRLMVPILGGVKAPSGSRRISHVCFDVDDVWHSAAMAEAREAVAYDNRPTTMPLSIRFGYPGSKLRKGRIEIMFNSQLDSIYRNVSLYADKCYVDFERQMTQLIFKLKTQRLDDSGEDGYNVLHMVIHAEFGGEALRVESQKHYWISEYDLEAPKNDERVKPALKESRARIPNFTRNRHMFRPSGRPR